MKLIKILFLILIIYSCERYPDTPVVPPINPCDTINQKLDFQIWEIPESCCDTVFDVDSVLAAIDNSHSNSHNLTQFIPSGNYDRYIWYIQDNDREFEGKVYGQIWGKFTGTVKVRLIGIDTTDEYNCRNGKILIDTVYKTLTILPYDQSQMLGTFRGVNLDKPLDTFNIVIDYWFNKLYNDIGYRINNLPKGCTDPPTLTANNISMKPTVGYRVLYLSETQSGHFVGGNCKGAQGQLVYDTKSNLLIANYSIMENYIDGELNPDFTRFKKTFIGYKIGK